MFRTVRYYRGAAEECYRLSNLYASDSCKEAMVRLGDAYIKLAKDLEAHEAKVETRVNRALRNQARVLHDQPQANEGTAEGA